MSRNTSYFPPSLQSSRGDMIHQGQSKNCPIWGNRFDNKCIGYSFANQLNYWSPRAGGKFSLSGSLAVTIQNYVKSDGDRVVLSKWIFDKNIVGETPHLDTNSISRIIETTESDIDEKLKSLLNIHSALAERPSIGLWISGSVYDGVYDIRNLRFAATESIDQNDYNWLQDAAISQGVLELSKNDGNTHTRLTPKGLSTLALKKQSGQEEQAFVAMWFNSEVDAAYENAIEPTINRLGYKTYRVDKDKSHSDQITNKILAEIKNSKFLIADFTHGSDGARGGVYFEAGFAMGLGKPIIWLIRDDGTSKMHFDTNHYPHIHWKNEEHLAEELEAAILAHQHIGKGPL